MKHSLMTMTALLGAEVQISSTAISQIFSVIDNKIIDAMMLLENEFGCLDDFDIDLSSKSDNQLDRIQKQLCLFFITTTLLLSETGIQ